jgi:N-methylhydantoinase B
MPAWGLLGGRPGGTPDNLIRRPTDDGFTSIDAAQVQAPAGTVVIQTSAGGGGWGDPFDREPALVARDVREGYVSAEAAEREYRVVLAADGQGVDEAATKRLRAEREKPEEAHAEQRPEVDGHVGT